MTAVIASRTGTAGDGTTLTVTEHGGQVLGWRPGGGRDLLWVSPLARSGQGEAIRGGVPVIFPQFAARGSLPKHGFARDRAWQVELAAAEAAITCHARLSDDDATRALWPHPFVLSLDARATAAELELTLTVHHGGGPPGTASPGTSSPGTASPGTAQFTAALHTYLVVVDPTATLTGLDDAEYEDNATGGSRHRLPAGPQPALAVRDIAVRDLAAAVTLHDGGERVSLVREGFDDLVVWHPGADHGLADVPAGTAPAFVCLEAAQLRPVSLAPGDTWRATARYRVTAGS